MRKLTVILAFILLALAALALAPEAALTPYADVAHAVLPKAISVAAFLLLLAIIADRPKAEPARIAAEAVNLAAAPLGRFPDGRHHELQRCTGRCRRTRSA